MKYLLAQIADSSARAPKGDAGPWNHSCSAVTVNGQMDIRLDFNRKRTARACVLWQTG